MTSAGGDQPELDLGLVPPAPVVVPDGVWQLHLPWSRPPLNMNDRSGRFAHARKVRDVRQSTRYLVEQAGIPALPRIKVRLHYVPRDSRRRDGPNLWATGKPCIDAIVDCGVVPDDTDSYVVALTPKIHPPRRGNRGQLTLVIQRLEAP